MANNFSLIGRKEYQLTDKLTIHIPLISELRSSFDDEMEYFKLVSNFIKTPCDVMVELDDIGIDYTQVKEYELFILSMMSLLNNKNEISSKHFKIIFPYSYINNFNLTLKNNYYVIFDNDNNVLININIYMSLAD